LKREQAGIVKVDVDRTIGQALHEYALWQMRMIWYDKEQLK
jgi:hypothetical protein